jgi:glycosyltransferase involved in cell wall biosynthesis
MTPLRIAYLLEDTAIAGGTRVVAAHGDALTDRGHEVTLVTRGGPLTWRGSRARWRHVQQFDELDAGEFDFIVGTFWTTLEAAHRIGGDKGVHFCQGYEGSFTAYQPMKEQIDAAYRLPLPKITVSPHLVEICRGFYDDATYIGQIVDDLFYQPRASGAGVRRRVLLVGPAQADFKGIDVGYEAVRQARAGGADFDLIRASQWPAAEGEPSELAAEFHVGLPSEAMARLFASCDLFLGPSRAAEGFGLPAAEALASGLPAVLSAIPSFLSWDEGHDYALFTPEGDGMAIGAALAQLLADDALRATLAVRGRSVVEQFRGEVTGVRLVRYFRR